MPLGWSDAALTQISGGVVRPAILLRIATDPVIRVWAGGIGDITIATDLIEDAADNLYFGFGEVTDVPAVNQLINGLAERIEFGLTGAPVTAGVAALANGDAASIRGAAVNLGFLARDVNEQVITPTAWLWEGEADSLNVDLDGSSGQQVRSLSLSVGSVMTGRRRPTPTYWTDPDQKRRSPTDRFFEHVKEYSQGTTKVWPE